MQLTLLLSRNKIVSVCNLYYWEPSDVYELSQKFCAIYRKLEPGWGDETIYIIEKLEEEFGALGEIPESVPVATELSSFILYQLFIIIFYNYYVYFYYKY